MCQSETLLPIIVIIVVYRIVFDDCISQSHLMSVNRLTLSAGTGKQQKQRSGNLKGSHSTQRNE